MRCNCVSKALHFLEITAKQQYCPFFTVYLTLKTLSQNISLTLLQISLKLHEHRGCYCYQIVIKDCSGIRNNKKTSCWFLTAVNINGVIIMMIIN